MRRWKTQLDEAIRGRRSIRRFRRGAIIPKADLEAIVEAAIWAPSSTNVQPWRFIVVTQANVIARVAQIMLEKCDRLAEQASEVGERRLSTFFRFMRQYGGFFGDASAVIVACAEPYDLGRFGLEEDSVVDKAMEIGASAFRAILSHTVEKSVAMAVQNLILKAHELGYGSCVMDAPLLVENELRQMLDIPREQQLITVIPLGLPAHLPQPPRRKSIADVVRYVFVHEG